MRFFGSLALVCLLIPVARAQTTQPKLTETAEPVVNRVRDAYTGLTSLELAGTLSFELDAAGEKQMQQQRFTAAFRAPAHFRHEMMNDMLIVSDARKLYVYKTDQKRYVTADAPENRVDSPGDLPQTVRIALVQQNPSLLAALCKDVSAIAAGAKQLDRAEDVTIDGASHAVLTATDKGQAVRAIIDPKTHLIRRYEVDLKEYLTAQGVPQVHAARVTIDYTKSTTNAELADAAFAWSAPSEAMLVKLADPNLAEDAGTQAGQVLVGKAAPEFALKDLDGNDVSLEKLAGNVVVLDFWATWCGPCIRGMPHIDQLHKDLADQGVKVFAVNFNEPATKVKPFLTTHNLTLPVLLDSDGKVSAAYKAPPIPQTFVIGRDGKVKMVFVGYGPGVEKQVREAVEAAMKD